MQDTIIFCHGLESSPTGAKYQALSDAGLQIRSPDFRGLNLQQRVDKLVPVLAGCRQEGNKVLLVGSSYGGITAVLAAMAEPEAVGGMVLCAPALGLTEPPAGGELEARVPVVIIHGTPDDVCPIRYSREFARQPGVRLVEVDDGHRLSASLPVIVEEVQLMLRNRTAPSAPGG